MHSSKLKSLLIKAINEMISNCCHIKILMPPISPRGGELILGVWLDYAFFFDPFDHFDS